MTGEQQDNLQPSCDLRFIFVQMYALINVCSTVHMTRATLTACMNRYSTLPPEVTYTVLNNFCNFSRSISHCQDLGWPILTAYINLCVNAWYIPLYSTLPFCQLCKYCHLQPLNRNVTVDPHHLGYSGSKSSVITMQILICYMMVS